MNELANAANKKELIVPVCEKYTLTIREAAAYFKEDFAFSKLRERYKKWTGNSFDEKDLMPSPAMELPR